MKQRKKYIILMISMIASFNVFAKNIEVKASMDSSEIYIGNQTKLTLEMTVSSELEFEFPILLDNISKEIEIVTVGNSDTITLENNFIKIHQDYIITSFDSGVYVIPPFKFLVEDDEIYSNTLTLKVKVPPIEISKESLKDIKPNLVPPFDWYTFWLYFGAVFVIVVIIVLLVIIYKLNKKDKTIFFIDTQKKIPAHLIAIQELDKIKLQKLWQKGREKEYYTKITDVLRIYIEDRFSMSAMEMTSDEILENIKNKNDYSSIYESLKQVLKAADLAKFANIKMKAEENELSIINSYLFVNQTKIEEETEDENQN